MRKFVSTATLNFTTIIPCVLCVFAEPKAVIFVPTLKGGSIGALALASVIKMA